MAKSHDPLSSNSTSTHMCRREAKRAQGSILHDQCDGEIIIVNPRKLEHRFRMIHAGIPFALL